jgi:hypothetical protein
VGWSSRGEFRRGARGELRCREEEEEETGEETGFGLSFIGVHGFVEESGRERAVTRPGSGRWATPASPSGAWQLLSTGGPTWVSGGRPVGAARAVGGVVGRRVEQNKGGADLQGLRRWPAAEITRAAESRGDQGLRKMMEDLGAISQKCRDLTEMLW